MDFAAVKKWVVFFIGILCAIVIADLLSSTISAATGDGRMDKVPGEFHPLCGFFLCSSLCHGKNFPYRIFWFLAHVKKEFIQSDCFHSFFKRGFTDRMDFYDSRT